MIAKIINPLLLTHIIFASEGAQLSIADQNTLLAHLTQTFDTKKRITDCVISPYQSTIVIAYDHEGKGLCEQWSIPILRKKAEWSCDEPIVQILFTPAGFIILRSTHNCWLSQSLIHQPALLTKKSDNQKLVGMHCDNDTQELVLFSTTGFRVFDIKNRESITNRSAHVSLAIDEKNNRVLLQGRRLLFFDQKNMPHIYRLPALQSSFEEHRSRSAPTCSPFEEPLKFNGAFTPLKDAVVLPYAIVVTLHQDSSLCLWNLGNAHELKLIKKADVASVYRPYERNRVECKITALAVSPSGVAALYGTKKGCLIFELEEDIFNDEIDLECTVRVGQFHPDRTHLFILNEASEIIFVNSKTREKLFMVKPKRVHELPAEKLIVSNDGALFLTYDTQGLISISYGSNFNNRNYFKELSQEQLSLMSMIAHLLNDPVALKEFLTKSEGGAILNSLDRAFVAALLPPDLILLKNADGWLPLHEAVFENDLDALRRQLELTNDSDARGHGGMTALMCAAKKGSVLLMGPLLEKGASPFLEDESGRNSAAYAIESNNCEALALLTCHGVHNNDVFKLSCLKRACEKDKAEIVGWLLNQGLSVNARDRNQRTGLHHAAGKLAYSVVVMLIAQGADLSVQDDHGDTPLHLAIQEGGLDVSEYLMGQGAPLSLKNKDQELPFDRAFRINSSRLIAALVSAQMRLLGCAGEGDLLHYAAFNGHTQLVRYLLETGRYELLLDKDKNSPLHLACAQENSEVIDLLLTALEKRQATFTNLHAKPIVLLPINYRNNAGVAPLHLIMKLSTAELSKVSLVTHACERMLKLGAMIDILTENQETPLHFASFYGNEVGAVRLIESGAAIEALTKELKTPLHLAIEGGHTIIMKLLLNRGARATGVKGCIVTPLHTAACKGDSEAVEILLEAGANPASVAYGKTPACFAAQEGHQELCEYLLEELKKACEAPVGWNILHVASDHGLIECVSALLQADWDPDGPTEMGDTALHLAAETGQVEIVEQLLYDGASIDKKDALGKTALHRAIIQEQPDCTRVLCNRGASVLVRDDAEFTALDYAVKSLFMEGIEILLRAEFIASRGELENEIRDDATSFTSIEFAQHLGYDELAKYLQSHEVERK